MKMRHVFCEVQMEFSNIEHKVTEGKALGSEEGKTKENLSEGTILGDLERREYFCSSAPPPSTFPSTVS
jgi:hypothetical protein